MIAYEGLAEKENFEDILARSIEMYPRYLSKHPDDARAHMFFALALTQAGKIDDAKGEGARAIALSPEDPLMLYNASCFYARLGEKQQAIETLKNAIATGYEFYEWIKRDTDLDSLRDEPEYKELMNGK